MTPSEIAEALDAVVATQDASKLAYKATELAAATIRAQAEALKIAEERVSLLQETIKAQSHRSADQFARIDDKLKIATEALEKMVALYDGENDPENIQYPQWLVDALFRIKETK